MAKPLLNPGVEMRLNSGYEERKARIELLPLMDVMFLILVFFIYSIFTMAVHRGIKVELPKARAAHLRGEQVVVTLTADNELLVNKQPMSFDEAVTATLELSESSELPVLISADRMASLGVGIELLGKLKDGGVERIAFQTAPDIKSPNTREATAP